MLVMLASAAWLVCVRLRADLDDSVDASLRSRADALAGQQGAVDLAAVGLEDSEETFIQLLSPTGSILGSIGTVQTAALSPAEAGRAATGVVILERDFPGVDGRTRVYARGSPAEVVVVVGRSLLDRNEALSSVVSSFAIGGSIAVLLASAAGYLIATAGFAPVEAMRRRAREVSLGPGDTGLPLPAAHDEIHRLGETLNEMLDRLRAAYQRERRFVADASHELRTPIAIIRTELEGALQVTEPRTAAHQSLGAAVEECDRLTQLAEDLLVLARAADGKLPIRCDAIDAHDLLCSVRDRFSDRASRRGRSIRVEAPAGLRLFADPLRLRQALGNLVENALRHGAGPVAMVARRSGGGVELDVSDEGPGFPPGFETQAFERFARPDRSRGDGVGLGLAIVRAIAETHRGSTAVVGSAPATVRIRLPDVSGR